MDRRIRVVHIIGSLDRGGAETVTVDLVERTAAELASVVVTLRSPAGALADQVRRTGAAVIECPLRPLVTFPYRLRRTLGRIAPDAVVSHVLLFSAVILPIARLAGVRRRVARIHSAGDGHPDSSRRFLYRWITRRILRWSATDIIAVSSSALRFVSCGLAASQMRVLRNGVDVDRFVPSAGPTGEQRILLHVGRNAAAKNRTVLPGIFAALSDLDPSWRLVVAGPGGTSDMALGTVPADRRDHIRLLGEVAAVEHVLSISDVLILPSTREGMPGVILEALACGVPVVCSDIPPLRELAEDLPGIRLVAPSAASAVWAEAIREACQSFPRPAVHLRGGVIASALDSESIAAEWVRLFRGVARGT